LQTALASSAQVPWKHSENVSHVVLESLTVQGCPSGITVGQVPLTPAPGGGPKDDPTLHDPTRQRTSDPLQGWPAEAHVIAAQAPEDEPDTGSQPSPALQTSSLWQDAPAGPAAQTELTHPSGGRHPPG
jgi:hypothetical protein